MLLDCPIILGGEVGAYLEEYLPQLRELAGRANPFSDHADYLLVCQYKIEAIAAGSALPFINEFLDSI